MTAAELREASTARDSERPSPIFAWMTVAFTLFIVYGSLVPFEYRAVSHDAAAAKLQDMLRQPIGPDTSSDWAANVLLFVPFAFFLAGCLGTGHRWRDLIKPILPVFGFAFLVGVAVESAQIYFPPRNPSLNDLLAQSIGTALGLVAWKFWGQALSFWLGSRSDARQGGGGYRSLCFAYIAGLVIYSAFPLDLSMSMTEVYRKLRDGHIVLLPFGFAGKEGAELLYDLVTDVLIWIPPAILVWRAFTPTPRQVFAWLFALAIGIEFMQIFVMSRIADVTDVLLAALGIVVGTRIGVRIVPRSDENKAPLSLHVAASIWLPLAGGLLWAIVVMLVFWYPYDFSLDRELLARRWQGLSKLPFIAYFASTEYRALTEALHKSSFFLPFGVALGWMGRSRGWLFYLCWVMVFLFACGIEVGKMMLPGRSPDLGNLLVETFGAFVGYVLMSRRMGHTALSASIRFSAWSMEVFVLLACALILGLALAWPLAPVLLRDAMDSPFLFALLVALCWFYGLARLPLLAFAWERSWGGAMLATASFVLLAVCGAAFLALAFSTVEVGANAIWQAVLIWALFGGALTVALKRNFFRADVLGPLLWLSLGPFIFGALYWNLETASFDNSESLHPNKARAAFTFMLALWFLGVAAAYVSRRIAYKAAYAMLASMLVWLALAVASFHLMRAALADVVIIDGRVFSGLEYFLRPPVGGHALGQSALLLRYLLICAIGTVVVALLQYPFWRKLALAQMPSGR